MCPSLLVVFYRELEKSRVKEWVEVPRGELEGQSEVGMSFKGLIVKLRSSKWH